MRSTLKKKTSNLPPKKWDNQTFIERQTAQALSKLTEIVNRVTHRFNDPQVITAQVAEISKSKAWEQFSNAQAMRMVGSLSARNALTWKEAAAKSGNGLKIYQSLKTEFSGNKAIQAILHNNASMIKSLPIDVAKHITQYTNTQAIRGLRPAAMVEHIRKRAPELSEARVNLIARTETAKTQSAITQIRATKAGFGWYEWETAQDGDRVRKSHRIMQGVLCQYSDPPSPELLAKEQSHGCYGPGETFNCRCFSAPVINPDFLSWPRKVYYQGKITRMSKAQFMRIYNA